MSPLRSWHPGCTTLRVAKDGGRTGMGVCESLSQSFVQSLHSGEKVGLLLWSQSRLRGRASRESSGTRKAHPHARTDFAADGCAPGTYAHDGVVVPAHRLAHWRSPGIALEKRGFCFGADSGRTSLLPGDHRVSKN